MLEREQARARARPRNSEALRCDDETLENAREESGELVAVVVTGVIYSIIKGSVVLRGHGRRSDVIDGFVHGCTEITSLDPLRHSSMVWRCALLDGVCIPSTVCLPPRFGPIRSDKTTKETVPAGLAMDAGRIHRRQDASS